MKMVVMVMAFFMQQVSLYACMADMTSAGIVLNSGEYCDFEKIEAYGDDGVNYVKEIDSSSAGGGDTIIINDGSLSKARRIPLGITASLLSADFHYDPDAGESFLPKPMIFFNGDTMIIHDYWALTQQPSMGCSLSVSNDTLVISYLALQGPVNDWMPSVETVLKILWSGHRRVVTVRFNGFAHHAREPRTNEAGFRDAREDLCVNVSVPPNMTYKYRAHSYAWAMVYLHYEQHSAQYRNMAPRISISFDTTIRSIDTMMYKSVVYKELQWLMDNGICTIAQHAMERVGAVDTVQGSLGTCYWTKQDSTIALNQWFQVVGDTLRRYGMRSGCGLGTDYKLPPSPLGETGTIGAMTKPVVKSAFRTIKHNGTLVLQSPHPFDQISVYTLLGREIMSVKFPASRKVASIKLPHRKGIHGNYIVELRSAGRKVSGAAHTF